MGSNSSQWAIVTPIVAMVLCTTGVAVRVFTRMKYANRKLYIEDWLVIGPAYICSMGIACTMIVAAKFGLGSHIDEVSKEDLVKILKTLYGLEAPLVITLNIIRISLLQFVKRLSRDTSRCVYLVATAIIPFIILYSVTTIIVAMLRCTPVRAQWTPDIKNAHCLSPIPGFIFIAIGFALDLFIFALPAILVVNLTITRKKKFQSVFMFALGGAGCIIECFRFQQLHKAITHPDITYNMAIFITFFYFQVVLGLLCCCAPALKAFASNLNDSIFRRSSYLGSESNGMREGVVGENNDENSSRRDLEIAATGVENSFAIEVIEMESKISSNYDENKTLALQKIMDLEEVMRIHAANQSLPIPSDDHTSSSSIARSESSHTCKDIQAVPAEWGR
ncbi:hypothetical protein TWF694_010015 [Orbilia ellipsospora]|uniref:Rhodopsin domain-containing protein n=1 Tax=Orbilia ellipsospora TaxID=2528407 RepID=A0AAV9X8P2_9PEZI